MALDTIPKQEGGKLKAVASGTLPSGKPVVVNSDGTVSVVSETSISEGVGSNVVFESATTTFIGSAYDAGAKRVVIAYRDDGNSSYGTAVVCEVDGTSLTFGTPVVFSAAEVNHISLAFDSSNNKIVIAWHNYVSGTDTGQAIVATVDSSNNSISFGSAATFESGDSSSIGCGFDSTNNKVVIAYKDHSNSNRGTAIVGTVSGTSISFGSAVVFETGAAVRNIVMFDSSNDKIVIAYSDQADGDDGKAIVGTVSGTSISFGSSTAFETGGVSGNWMGAAFDTTNNKVVIAYADGNNSAYGTGIVGTVSGTSISFGTPTVFESANSNYINVAFNALAGKVIIAYQDKGNSDTGTYVEGTVSGTSISFDTPTTFPSTADAIYTSVTYDSDQYASVISFMNTDNSSYGTSFSYQSTGTATNLTSENYIGMSGGAVDAIPEELGTAAVFENDLSQHISAAYDSNSNKVVLAYTDTNDGQKGKAVVGTVSGTSISFGTPATFENGSTSNTSTVFDTSTSKIVILYQDSGNSGYGTSVVGTVSGTSISFGTPVVFESANTGYVTSSYDANAQKVVVSYSDIGNSRYGTAIVGTVSGTSISFGSPVVFESGGRVDEIGSTYDSVNQKVVIGYTKATTTGEAIVGTVSGTSISFGTPVQFYSGNPTFFYTSLAYDSSSQKVIVAYSDYADSSHGNAVVGTVSGTSISFGSATVFEAASTSYISASYSEAANKVVITYTDGGNSNYGTASVGTVSGTSISFETPLVFSNNTSYFSAAVYDEGAGKTVISYRDDGNSGYGTAKVLQISAINRGSVANSDNATVDIVGTVSTNQVGLTAGQQYYVQTDGTIGTTADDPSVLAGTAVSATKMVVKS